MFPEGLDSSKKDTTRINTTTLCRNMTFKKVVVFIRVVSEDLKNKSYS